MHRLDRLDVVSRKVLTGKVKGERRSKKKGQSVEFADYRQYVMGDDLRFIDWNLYARLDKLFLRLFMEEEDLSVSIVVDASKSMDFGDPNKLWYARRVAAALGYIGLTHYNRVSLYAVTSGIAAQLPNLRGRRPVPRMLAFLSDIQPAGAGDFTSACRRLALAQSGKGIVILISDFLDKGDLAEALGYLNPDRFDTYAIQLLAPQEIDPVKGQIIGDLQLKDIEDGDLTEISVTPALLKQYKATLQAYCKHVRSVCLKRDAAYLVGDTQVPFDTLVLRYLRERGLLT